MSKPFVDVAAALVLQPDGRLLLAERPGDKPWSGWWELPGGKIEPGESVIQALTRELDEELGIQVTQGNAWVTYTHEYPKTIVRLAFCRVTGWNGTPWGAEGQKLAWVDPRKPLPVGPLLPAGEPPLRWLLLPDHYLVTSIGGPDRLASYLQKLQVALKSGIQLVQFREPGWPKGPNDQTALDAFYQVRDLCRRHGARCLVNSVHPHLWWPLADGVHLRSSDAAQMLTSGETAAIAEMGQPAPGVADPATREAALDRAGAHLVPRRLLGMSTHTEDDLVLARKLRADFAVLGHVLSTPSHAQEGPMGWARFKALAEHAGLPVFAIGGQTPLTFQTAQRNGAHGIAGIRNLI